MSHRRMLKKVASVAVLAALVFSFSIFASTTRVQAQEANNWMVQAGEFNPDEGLEINQFAPRNITIVEGDTITWNVIGFHTASLLSGGERPVFIIPGEDGLPIVNPAAAFPSEGTEYDGTGVFSSGIPPAPEDPEAPPPLFQPAVTFTAFGEYQLVCLIHPAMFGTISVLPAGSTAPLTQEDLDDIRDAELAALNAQAEAALAANQDMVVTDLDDGSQEFGLFAGLVQDDIEYLRYIPNNDLTVNVGDTVTWDWAKTEAPHTVSFLSGGDILEGIIPIFGDGPDAPPTGLALNPAILPPSGEGAYSGEGFFSSGVLNNPDAPGPPGAPSTYSLSFDTAGTYDYLCLIHGPIMSGSITVVAPAPAPVAEPPATGGIVLLTPLTGAAAGVLGISMIIGGGLVIRRRVWA